MIGKKHSRLIIVLLCLSSALMLGFASPFYMPYLFGEVNDYQSWLGCLAFIAYMPFFLAIRNASLKASFLMSLFTLTIRYTIVLFWIFITLHYFAHLSALPAAGVTLLLPLVLSLMETTFIVLGRFLSLRFNFSFLVIAPFSVCAAEYFRNYYLFGGFPWGHMGLALAQIDEFLQVASLFGVYGLVFLSALTAALFAQSIARRGYKNAPLYACAAGFIIIASFVFGAYRLKNSSQEFAPTVRVGLLQGNISQEVKNTAQLHFDEIRDIYINLEQLAFDRGAELVVWPESSYPRMLDKMSKVIPLVSHFPVATIVGASVYGDNPHDEGFHVHNSMFLMDYQGKITSRYDKSHLVPFGEYVPWPMTGIVDKVVEQRGSFLPGIDFIPTTLRLSERKTIVVGSTVCYEGVFPEITRTYAKKGADLLVNVTNDAWYGRSSQPYQHLTAYKLRSVETGLPFVRATNAGISATIDSYGRIKNQTKLFEREVLIADVELQKIPTLYLIIGDIVPIVSVLLLLLAYVAAIVPLRHFVRQRQWKKLLILALLLAVVIISQCYFSSEHFITDESARTKSLGIFLLCLLLMIGLLSKSALSRSILFIVSAVIIFCSVMLAFFESSLFLIGVLFGLLIYLLAFRMKTVTNNQHNR